MGIEERRMGNSGNSLNTVMQNVILENREKLSISGVNDVLSFDDQIVLIETESFGLLTVKGENLKINGVIKEHLESLFSKFEEMGIEYNIEDFELTISKSENLKPCSFKSQVFPGFPTDIGQPMSVLLTQCNGVSFFEETIYDNRMGHVKYLNNILILNKYLLIFEIYYGKLF